MQKKFNYNRLYIIIFIIDSVVIVIKKITQIILNIKNIFH
ncbi:hypothetical protein MCETHM1_01653 [Flavobacteriaceae bacterium]